MCVASVRVALLSAGLRSRGWAGAEITPTCTGVALLCTGVALACAGVVLVCAGIALLQCWSRLVGSVLKKVVLEAQALQRCPKFHLVQLQL